MNNIITKIALHYDRHSVCGIDICPMAISESESIELFDYFNSIWPMRPIIYPRVDDNFICRGVKIFVVSNEVKNE